MMKRWIAVLASVCLLCTFGLSVSAEPIETVDFSMIANDAAEGESVILTVSIPENSYFTNATFYVHYDPAVLTYVEESIAGGAISPSAAMYMAGDHADKGYVKCVYVTVDGIVEGGELITMEFLAKSDAVTQLSLTFDECTGVDENGVEFMVNYTTEPVVINGDASELPAASVSTTTTKPKTDEPEADHTVLFVLLGVVAAVAVGVTVTLIVAKRKQKKS